MHRLSALIRKFHINPFIGDKFGLGRHDRLAVAGLRHFVNRSAPFIGIGDSRKDHKLHKIFNEGGLSRPHRPHAAYVYGSAGAPRNILIQVKFFCHVSVLTFSQYVTATV